MSIELTRFNMEWIKFDKTKSHGPVIVFIGRRDTGKSFLVRDLLFYHQNLRRGIVMSGTESIGDGFFKNHIPKCMIYDEYNTATIYKLLQNQKQELKRIKKETEAYGRSNIDARTFCILDDCLYDKSWANDKLMRMLFMNGRHWKIMLVITMQYPLGIPPNLRTNIDYVFILRENYKKNRKIIWENYAGMFPTFDSFEQVMDQCTENYECLVINNNAKSNKLNDQIFWYKAEPHKGFKLCEQAYWDYSSRNCNSSDDDDDEPYDPNSGRKKNYQQITVKKSSGGRRNYGSW